MAVVTKARIFGCLGVLLIILAVPIGYIQWHNLVWLDDPHEVVQSAKLFNSLQSTEMTVLPWGGYVAYIHLEGGIEVTCMDGTVTSGGYVSRYLGGRYEVDAECNLNWIGQ